MIKPTRQQWLTFASLLIAAGLFPAIWNIATQVWPEAELLATIEALLAKSGDQSGDKPLDVVTDGPDASKTDPVRPPSVDMPDEKPTDDIADSATTSRDEAFFSALKWLRSDTTGPSARVTKQLTITRIDRGGIRFQQSGISDWPSGLHKGVMCIAVLRAGRWEGGKFDHLRADTTSRDFNNVCGYINVCPRSGEAVRFWMLSYDGRQASNVEEVRWP